MASNDIAESRAGKYWKQSLWVNMGLTLLLLFILQVRGFQYNEVKSVAITAVYTLVVSILTSLSWRAAARSDASKLTLYYLASAVGKLLLAVLTLVVYCMLARGNRELIIAFIVVFAIYFFVFLIFDSAFFFITERSRNKTKVNEMH